MSNFQLDQNAAILSESANVEESKGVSSNQRSGTKSVSLNNYCQREESRNYPKPIFNADEKYWIRMQLLANENPDLANLSVSPEEKKKLFMTIF